MKNAGKVIVIFITLIFLTTVSAWAGSVIDRIAERGELIVGTTGNQPPLNAKTKEGNIIGLDADLAQFMAHAMEVELRFEVMPFADLLPALEDGKVDMIISGMTITPSRNLKVAFVGPYYITGKSILTKFEKMASMNDANELNSSETKLAAMEGSTGQAFVEEFIPKATLVTTTNYDEAIRMVINDKVDALIADHPSCAIAAFRFENEGLFSTNMPFTYEPLGIAVPEGDPLFINWVHNVLLTLENSGELRKIGEKWFKDGSWIEQLPALKISAVKKE